jgi:uncharacterized protein YeaO (DUF488 family)
MTIHVVRLGSPRHPDEGPRLGTVRRPPRGVRKDDIARRDFYDVWLPELAPSAELLSWATADEWDDARWKRFARMYEKEMKAPAAQHLLALLSVMSRDQNLSVGCYCADRSRCHRTLLANLLSAAGGDVVVRD